MGSHSNYHSTIKIPNPEIHTHAASYANRSGELEVTIEVNKLYQKYEWEICTHVHAYGQTESYYRRLQNVAPELIVVTMRMPI